MSPQRSAWRARRHETRRWRALLNLARPYALALGAVRWSGSVGALYLAPAYPNGGEDSDHVIDSFSHEGVRYVISLHAWAAVFRFSVGGHQRQERLHGEPGLAATVATLRAVVAAAAEG